ncbi:MAG: hypothetical protein A2505_10965 [Deltaproteobacteria bacterium RIFOXYD12_FULL_55_16]|nr:MAG: hypothetical protein A2505_10965 [Deltaproteobacteria bacterium RIFOXYD12_FULL_55_16]
MAGINQINAAYLPAEDRLLLRISSQAGEEFRFWLTRRVVAGLLAAFGRTVDSWAETMTPDDIPGREVLRDFKREQLTSQGDFSRAYDQDDKILPLGEAAVLVGGVNIKLVADGAVLNLGLADGRNMRLQLSIRLLGGFHRILVDSARKAEWQIDLSPPAPEGVSVVSSVIQ